MTIDWSLISQIATTIGALIGGLSLFVGFAVYYLSKRDAEIAALKISLSSARSKIDRLNQLVTFELSHELISIVLYSNEVTYLVEKVTTDFFQQEDKSIDDLKAFLDEYFPILVTAFHTDLVEQYENLLSGIEHEISPYQSVYPGIHRVVTPSLHIFKQILKGNKAIVRKEDVWRKLIVIIFEKERDKATSYHFIQTRLMALFVALLEEKRKKQDQSDIDDLLTIINIVVDGYLSKSEHQLVTQRRKEKSEKLKPSSEFELATDDIKEAEKCLTHILSQNNLLRIRELSTQIRQRNESEG